MSITHQERFACSCGAVVEALVADSLNAGRHPHLKELLLARQLHRFRCAGCGSEFVVDKPLFYFDLPRRQFVCVFPPGERADEREHMRVTLVTFDKVLGAGAAAAVPVAPTEFMVRMVYGYEELREKIVIDDAGLSDLVVESLKADIMVGNAWFAEHAVLTLRLDRVRDDGALVFQPEWIGGPPLDEVPEFVAERRVYDELRARYDELLAQRPGLANGPHCSLLRLVDWKTVDNPWAQKVPSVHIERKLGPGEA
jgi:CpXC motif protein